LAPAPATFENHLATTPSHTVSPSAMDRGCGMPPRPTDVEREMESLDFRSFVQRN
jgi:hypothetical protein